MKGTALVAAVLVAGTTTFAATEPQKISLRVFTAPDDGGFVTAESKARQALTAAVIKTLSKEKTIALKDDAPVTLEILSQAVKATGTVETVVLPTVGRQNFAVTETHITAVLKFKDYTKEFDVVASSAGSFPVSAQTRFEYEVKTWLKDNAAKLSAQPALDH